jgi:hypothetical protein
VKTEGVGEGGWGERNGMKEGGKTDAGGGKDRQVCRARGCSYTFPFLLSSLHSPEGEGKGQSKRERQRVRESERESDREKREGQRGGGREEGREGERERGRGGGGEGERERETERIWGGGLTACPRLSTPHELL